MISTRAYLLQEREQQACGALRSISLDFAGAYGSAEGPDDRTCQCVGICVAVAHPVTRSERV